MHGRSRYQRRRGALPLLAAVLAGLVALAACGGDTKPTGEAPATKLPGACATHRPVVPGPAAPADWPVYHHEAERHGVAQPASASGALSPLWGTELDGTVFAQPLVFQDLVIAATMHDTVYALDGALGCVVWQTSLGRSFLTCVQNSVIPCTGSGQHRLDCGNLPEVGITGTPAIDTATGTVYVVAYLEPGRFEMDALDLTSGTVRWRHPITLPGSDVLYQLSRPAVALANGRAYASFGGRAGDCGNYHGFVIGIQQDGRSPDVTFQVSPDKKGAVWAPGGPVVLPNGDLLVAAGNTETTGTYDGSEAVVRLTPDLVKTDFFAPPNWVDLNRKDFDIGSVGPTLLQDGGVFQVGKDGVGYLLDVGHLGGVGGQRFSAPLSGGCYAIGTTAYRPPLVYVPCDHGVTAVRVDGARFSVAWRGPDFRAGSPIVAGGLLWDYDFEGGFLWGLDPGSGAVRQKVRVGTGEHFVSVSASSGRLYVPAQRRLYAFGL